MSCEDQACRPTTVCERFECQTWEGDRQVKPALVLLGKFWCCPKCGGSYGESPHPDLKPTTNEGETTMDTITTAPAAELIPPTEPAPWEAIADGDFAIVELFGHTTLVGRIAEVERFGAKMLALEPIFAGKLLDAVFHGGAAIYRLTPCSREVAWNKQPKHEWQLPASIQAVVPAALLAAPTAPMHTSDAADLHDGNSGGDDDDGQPF